MSVSVSMSGSGAVGLGVGVGSYQPGVYVHLKALFLVSNKQQHFENRCSPTSPYL